MQLYKQSAAVLFALIALTMSHLSYAQDSRARIGFGSTINDDEIKSLVSDYDVSPKKALTWASGLSGTHVTSGDGDENDFIKEIRSEAIAFFENAVASNDIRLQNFLDANSEEQINEDINLQTQARSLLNARAQMDGALATARSSNPMIYAIEVEGDFQTLRALETDPKVKVYTGSDDFAADTAGRSPLKPAPLMVEYRDADVLAASPQDLRQLMIDKLSEAEGVQ